MVIRVAHSHTSLCLLFELIYISHFLTPTKKFIEETNLENLIHKFFCNKKKIKPSNSKWPNEILIKNSKGVLSISSHTLCFVKRVSLSYHFGAWSVGWSHHQLHQAPWSHKPLFFLLLKDFSAHHQQSLFFGTLPKQ